jgi:hypothetical protein
LLKKDLFGCTLRDLEEAEQKKTLPPDFFIDVRHWFWSVKEDGYFVKLIRNEETQKWSIYTRKDIELLPPPDFLAGLEKNEHLPSVMHGELLTCFTGCSHEDRKDIEKRAVLRNQQFKKLNRIFHNNPSAWDDLRVKIFFFPLSDMTIRQAYNHYSQIMKQTLAFHPHIGMCRSGTLRNTKNAIDIFNSTVQMGLEGIVIVDADVKYGTLVDRHNDDTQLLFKLKQKLVLPETQILLQDRKMIWKDGKADSLSLECFYMCTMQIQDIVKTFKFRDQQLRNSGIPVRLKYMERVAGATGNEFPCIDGFRHMHIATQYDMSVEVPADDKDKTDILFALGVTDCNRLYNPQAFRSKSTHESSFLSRQASSLKRNNARVLPALPESPESMPEEERAAESMAEEGRAAESMPKKGKAAESRQDVIEISSDDSDEDTSIKNQTNETDSNLYYV